MNETDYKTKEDTGYQPEKLKKWKKKSNYIGKDYRGWYVAYSSSGDLLGKSNFDVFAQKLEQYIDSKNHDVEIAHFNHWAGGDIRTIMIHQSESEALQIADKLQKEKEDYPILDEDDYDQRRFQKTKENTRRSIRWSDLDEELTESEIECFLSKGRDMNVVYPDEDGSEFIPEDKVLEVWEKVKKDIYLSRRKRNNKQITEFGDKNGC